MQTFVKSACHAHIAVVAPLVRTALAFVAAAGAGRVLVIALSAGAVLLGINSAIQAHAAVAAPIVCAFAARTALTGASICLTVARFASGAVEVCVKVQSAFRTGTAIVAPVR